MFRFGGCSASQMVLLYYFITGIDLSDVPTSFGHPPPKEKHKKPKDLYAICRYEVCAAGVLQRANKAPGLGSVTVAAESCTSAGFAIQGLMTSSGTADTLSTAPSRAITLSGSKIYR